MLIITIGRTDNSAALLTTEHKHFDPKELLTQDFTDSRGFVRTGGAIFGQRPAFHQIKAISTLCASVSCVDACNHAIFKML
mmetsp:Transcript_7518/g.18087  ORF Transcript_7518/g.18087 Transcript_7518/m.18087 type:complete len:81 (+) Transcript_7518:1495-1737(+)